MFSWQEQYLTHLLRSLVRYCSCNSNIKLISSCHHVRSSIYPAKLRWAKIATKPYFWSGASVNFTVLNMHQFSRQQGWKNNPVYLPKWDLGMTFEQCWHNMQKACIQPAQRAPCKTGLTAPIPASVARMGWLLACCHSNHLLNLTETQFN